MTETTTQNKTTIPTGHVVHTEFASTDVDATCTFLKTVFGWELTDMGGPQGAYWTFGDQDLGISGAIRPLMEQDPGPYSTPYVGVDDLDAVIQAATDAGATVMVPKTPVPQMGWFAWFQAPGGIVVAAWQNDPSAPAPSG